MKKIISYLFLVSILFSGLLSITVMSNKTEIGNQNRHENKLAENGTHSAQKQYYLSASNFYPNRVAADHIRLSFSFDNMSVRVFASSNYSRISHSNQLIQQKFHTNTSSFLLQTAHKHSDGHYFYHLRKLLI